MSQWALPAIAVMLIAYGAVSGRLRSTPVSQAIVFVALGVAAGNWFLDLVEADTANQFVRHLAEATLTLVLFCDTVRVNRGRVRHESALPTRLLGIGLPLTIVAGLRPGWACSPAEPVDAAALATMLAPTDAPSACRWSPTPGSPPASARASTSRAASTTACASPC